MVVSNNEISKLRFEISEEDKRDLASHLSSEFQRKIEAGDIDIENLQKFAPCKENIKKIKSRVFKANVNGLKDTLVIKQVYGGMPDILRDEFVQDVELESRVLQTLKESRFFSPRRYEFAERHIQVFPTYYGSLKLGRNGDKKSIHSFVMEFIEEDSLDKIVEKRRSKPALLGNRVDWKFVKDYLDPIILLHELPEHRSGEVRKSLYPNIIERRDDEDFAKHFIRYMEILSITDKIEWENPDFEEVGDAFCDLSNDTYVKKDSEAVIHGTALPEHNKFSMLIDAGSLRISSIGIDLGSLYGYPTVYNALLETESNPFSKIVETYLEKREKFLYELDPLRTECLWQKSEKNLDKNSLEIATIAGAYYANFRRAAGLLEFPYPYKTFDEVKKEVKDLKVSMEKQFNMLCDALSNKSYINTLSNISKKLEIFNPDKDYQLNYN